MADFTVREVEGMRQVRIDIRDETVRARRGAMSNMRGNDHADPEAARRRRRRSARSSPARRGCGRSTPAPARSCCSRRSAAITCSTWSEGEGWILEPGVYLGVGGRGRARALPRAVLREPLGGRRLPGLEDHGERPRPGGDQRAGPGRDGGRSPTASCACRGGWCWAAPWGSSSPRSARRAFPRNFISGQRRLRVFGGTGKALVCWTPYWNEHMYQLMTGTEHRALAVRVTAH